jgi:membrane protein required for colicin V production
MNFEGLQILDVVLAILLIVLAIRGAFRGLVEELSAMAALVLGVWAGLFFRLQAAAFIRSRWTDLDPRLAILPDILGFLAVLVAVFLLVKLIGLLLKGITERIMLGGLDRLLGTAFGAVEGLAASALILFILQLLATSVIPALLPIIEKSAFASFLLPIAGDAVNTLLNTPAAQDALEGAGLGG